MALPALVLVHGGAHAGDCWDLTVDEIHHLAPDLTEKVTRRGMPDNVPRTLDPHTARPHAQCPCTQFAGVEAIGGVQKLIPIDMSRTDGQRAEAAGRDTD